MFGCNVVTSSSTLMMVAAGVSEMLVSICYSTQHRIPEGYNCNIHWVKVQTAYGLVLSLCQALDQCCMWVAFQECEHTYGRCFESRVQCAAVSTWRGPTKEPPHQNSVRREPCRNMAAIHGHRPGRDSSPPTTRNAGTSGWPQSAHARRG